MALLDAISQGDFLKIKPINITCGYKFNGSLNHIWLLNQQFLIQYSYLSSQANFKKSLQEIIFKID